MSMTDDDRPGEGSDEAPAAFSVTIPRLRALSFDVHELGPRSDDTPPKPSVEQLRRQIRELQARVDELVAAGEDSGDAPSSVKQAAAPDSKPARDLLATDFIQRHWGRDGMRRRAEEVDEFGLDPKYEARLIPILDLVYRRYFRLHAEGTGNIPEQGRCLIVSNHSGGPLPYDGIMLRTTVRLEHPGHRELRWLAEDPVCHFPFVGTTMNRLGAVRACQENAERLLAAERLVAVFPEGVKGIGKLYKERYRLQRFGRGGFIRLSLRTGTPIVPCALIGAEEANPILRRVEHLAKAFGVPYLPFTPTFPLLGPFGLLPAPTKWMVKFGEIIRFDEHGPEAAHDDVLVSKLAERVRVTIQEMVDRLIAARTSVWFG